jgi:hypothetical protein
MSTSVKPKAAAAKRGCLTSRHWADIRQAARLARSEGITLITHGVTTIAPAARGKENLPEPRDKSTATTARGGRGLQPKEAIGKACEYPSAKEQHEQQPSKQQREQERSLRRLHEFQQAIACGARWEPLVQKLLRKERAISRHSVWTAHMSRKIELRNKMGEFLGRALRHLRSRALAIGERPVVDRDTLAQRRSGALAAGLLRRLFRSYRDVRHYAAATAAVNLRNIFLDYRQARDTEMAYTVLRMEPASSDLQLSPPGRRSTLCPLMGVPSDPPPEQRGANTRASKKPKSSRSKGRGRH